MNLLIILSMLIVVFGIIVCVYAFMPSYFTVDEKDVVKVDIYDYEEYFNNNSIKDNHKVLCEQQDINEFIDKLEKIPLRNTHINVFADCPLRNIVIHNKDNTEIDIDFLWHDFDYTLVCIMRTTKSESGIQILTEGKFYKISHKYLEDIFSFK